MANVATRQIVERWLEDALGDAAQSSALNESRLICHHPLGNLIFETVRGSEVRKLFEPDASAITRRQYFFLHEGNHIAVMDAGHTTETREPSAHYWLQIFRLEAGIVAETWFSGYARNVDWGALPREPTQRSGAEDTNKLVLRRWWEEMYSGHRIEELMPQLAGPGYVRHEPTGSWVTTIPDHLNRVKGLYVSADDKPRPRWRYQTLAEGEYAVGWGTMRGYRGGASKDDEVYSWAQLFRFAEGKLVETWFPGWLIGVDWSST